MKKSFRVIICTLLACTFFLDGLPVTEACGPGYLTPVFDYKYAPENPFDDFAGGKIGIIKPSYHRVVLFAAYRYLNGGSFTADEQKALVDVWNADFNNRDYGDNDVAAAVKIWVEARKSVVSNEEKLPEIYTEREYGGYDFFPNCTKNAFETAARTLSDRMTSHGADSGDVKDWVAGQDAVFTNCASGRRMPDAVNQTMPEWLQKDRAYQTAAAEFYSLDYEKAKNNFAEIAADSDSVWRETAEYLVARALIRQASLTSDASRQSAFYAEAETQLQKVAASGGKFADSSEKFSGLIKYRLHPRERVGELAQKLSSGNSDDDFRQDLIDYYWLLDKFEKEALEAAEKRREEEKAKTNNADKTNDGDESSKRSDDASAAAVASEAAKHEGQLSIHFYAEDYSKNWTIYVSPGASDDEAIAEAARVADVPLTDKMKDLVRSAKKYAYANLYSEGKQDEYQGGYNGDEKTSLSMLPDFLRRDDLTDWLFAYQVRDAEAYDYAVAGFKRTGADLWLMTALSKADKNSPELKSLLAAAAGANRAAPTFPTIAFHEARIFIEQNKQAEARKLLDEILDSSIDLPVSSRNQFLALRLKLARTMEDFLRDALPLPFAFDSDGVSLTIDGLIKQEQSYYDPEYSKESKEDYDREVEERYKNEKLIAGQPMLDDESAAIINEHFPLAVLLEARQSPALPRYLKERFALAIWTRALLLGDFAAASKILPDVIRLKPDAEESYKRFARAKTPAEQQNTALYIILKDEKLAPYIASGFGSTWENYGSGGSRWWCKPGDLEHSEMESDGVPRKISPKPKFLTPAQSAAAQAELKRLKTIGDAPKYLGTRILEWARRSPLDRRIPESLYIVYEANGWDKYGCGNDEELRSQVGNVLKKRYPDSEWTKKMAEETP